ncbi:hypothetical protein [Actinopolymorpha sp. B9G3]|uniref:hypothetical protein n=1 Tax=Actinopolymorpha sp. B9G3 TaxID=3158970 RepID=UPI0032D8D7FB
MTGTEPYDQAAAALYDLGIAMWALAVFLKVTEEMAADELDLWSAEAGYAPDRRTALRQARQTATQLIAKYQKGGPS